MLDADQRRLLGEFIRAHRERTPSEGPRRRRRTPGLQRDELAARAGISVTWCAWLEQGREVQASPEVLDRLAVALSLSLAERAYLFELAGRLDPEMGEEPAADAPPSLIAAVNAVSSPAYALDRLWTACCWNPAASKLFRGWLDEPARTRNLLRFVFLEPAARALIPEWGDRARRLLAEFRADYAHSYRDARVQALVEGLLADSPVFAREWEQQSVQHREGGRRAFIHPKAGVIDFDQYSFIPAERRDYKFVLLVPTSE